MVLNFTWFPAQVAGDNCSNRSNRKQALLTPMMSRTNCLTTQLPIGGHRVKLQVQRFRIWGLGVSGFRGLGFWGLGV